MKRFLLSLLIVFVFSVSNATIRQWIVPGPGLWNVAGNWSPSGIPAPGDDVVIDAFYFGFSTTVTLVVTLPNTAVTVNSIHISGNSFASSTAQLILPSSNITTPALTVTGTGDAFIIDADGVFKNSCGATSGASFVITATFRINSSGQYIHNTQTQHAAIVSQLSNVPGTDGEFRFDVPASSYSVSLSGITYGRLAFDASASGGAITYIASGASNCTVKDLLSVLTGSTLSLGMSADINTLNLTLDGTIDLQTGSNNNTLRVGGQSFMSGTITESGSGLPIVEFNGTFPQNIFNFSSQIFFNSVTFKINNALGLTFIADFVLPYKLDLTLGNITTSPTTMLIMLDNATVVGGSGGPTSSFVEGPMKKIGDELFVFPVGVGQIFAPLAINIAAGQATTDEFIAEYKRINPQSIHGNTVQSGQNHVSYVEYWTLNEAVGSASKFVSLAVNYTSFCHDLAHTYVSRWNGAIWTAESTTPITLGFVSPNYQGILSDNSPLASFGDFTLITDQVGTVNPLPIKLITFTAVKNNSSSSTINWDLETSCSRDAAFDVEKSVDGRNYTTLAHVQGSETSRFYTVNDFRLDKGITYYRLKMVDVDGKLSYSKTVALINDNTGILITSLAPNPVHTIANLNISAAHMDGVSLTIYDMSGRIMKQWHSNVREGNNTIPMDVAGLANGVYQVLARTTETSVVFRFVKN